MGVACRREAQEGGNLSIVMADSFCCREETNTIVRQLSSN